MQKDETNQPVRFGPFAITGLQGQVLRRGRPLALSPKAVAMLWTLAQRPGQVVSKDELFRAVWPETIVSEGVLTSRIRELRQALGDAAGKARYIETVSRRGYRFIAPIAPPPPVASSQYSVVSREEERQPATGNRQK
jgi:DNA-binding winged helix-turn-helix (wHTH) protein